MLIGVHHPGFNFNLADPSTSYVEMRTYSNLVFGFHLAHYRCAWCTGALCVSLFPGLLCPVIYISLIDLFLLFFCFLFLGIRRA